jgi:hypothetical protein
LDKKLYTSLESAVKKKNAKGGKYEKDKRIPDESGKEAEVIGKADSRDRTGVRQAPGGGA